ncbi:MAG: beta-propeller fold lactonase family protein [Planctomycetes bacterium]|nr:beta-propeller fold lactonase family protein [Planctomycetota bacterium]
MRWQTLLLALLAAPAAAQASYVHFEGAQVHPLRVTADGTRLFVCNTADARLEVYSLADADRPVLIRDIPVGLEPVSVAVRTADEVWVANALSDSVSIVSIELGAVVATLRVVDEPSDVAFAAGRAFVTAAAKDEVHVFDATTRAFVGKVAIPAKDPRALAVRGNSVYVLSQRSGNDTTVVPFQSAPTPPLPTNPNLPPAPQQAVVVAEDDPAWSSVVTWSLPDQDVFELDATTLAITRSFGALGTHLFDVVAHPSTNELFIAGTDARNLVRFEPNLRGHAIDSRVTRLVATSAPTKSFFELNPGVNYAQLPNPSALATALAEPTALALDAAAGRLYVAAQGTDRIGVLTLGGSIVARIEVGDTPGSLVDPKSKRGPRALALHPSEPRLYVLNRLSSSLAVLDTQAWVKLSEQPLAHDPLPANVSLGRRFLYDAKLSGNGTFSCAACHVDGDVDGLAWDLGDPGADMIQPPPNQPAAVPMHPMKGAMTTQSLRGLDVPPFHWRGDRENLLAFNGAFASLMGGTPLGTSDLGLLFDFLIATRFPPNPNQRLDRTLETTPAGANQAAGLAAFHFMITGAGSCSSCHALPSGTNGLIIPANVLQEPQQMKIPHLRNLYRRVGMPSGTSAGRAGFGFTHDGVQPTLTSFLAQPVFDIWPADTKDDLVEFLLAFDTGEAPTVGYQVTLDSTSAGGSSAAADCALLEAQAVLGNCELVARGSYQGSQRGLRFIVATGRYISDKSGVGPFTLAELKSQALGGQATWTLLGVPLLSGRRLGTDRDLDGVPDGDEGVVDLGGATAACSGGVQVFANGEPELGNALFAIVAHGAEPFAGGRVVLGYGSASGPISIGSLLHGSTLHADAHGFAYAARALPSDPSLVGVELFARAYFVDPCAPGGLARSNTLRITVRP